MIVSYENCFFKCRLAIFLCANNQLHWCRCIFFLKFVNIFNFDRKFYVFRITFPQKIYVIFLIFVRWWFADFKYLTKHHFKFSLSSPFWILIKPFLELFNFFDNSIQLLHFRGLYFEMLIFCSIIESIFQPETSTWYLHTFVIITLYIDSNT